ncbi:SH3 domain-containing protein [bacterium]|nr:SH3 domain-containing protein [bacterium]
MKHRIMVILSVVLVMSGGCSVITRMGIVKPPVTPATPGSSLVPAEGPIPGVPPEVEYSEYWIRNAANPDDIIMTPEQIEEFNKNNPLNGTYILDVLSLPHESVGGNARDYIAANARYLADSDLYVTGDIPLEQADRQRIIALMDTTRVPDIITLRFGVMLRRVEGKVWPTTIPLMKTPGDNEFDEGMVSTVDMGEPVALLHVSHDGRWSYVQHALYTCWVPSDAVAFGEIETIRELTEKDAFIVAVGHRVSIFATPDNEAAIGAIGMGGCLRLSAVGNDYCAVLIPGRGETGELVIRKGFVRRDSGISFGYPSFTIRNIYRQCFVLYGRRYGWGGMFEERDCSAYVLDVFRCFGFRLPRNSSRLAEASTAIISLDGMDRETRTQALINSPGGISILRMPGHVMIYLGAVDGKPYIIHDFWSWHETGPDGGTIIHRAARVAVTDLLFGEGSTRGAFIDRLTHITIIGNYTIVNP